MSCTLLVAFNNRSVHSAAPPGLGVCEELPVIAYLSCHKSVLPENCLTPGFLFSDWTGSPKARLRVERKVEQAD